MTKLPRKLTAVIIGLIAFVGGFMFLLPQGCEEELGVPSWERCNTWMGGPALSVSDLGLAHEFDILIPLAVGVLAGGLTWWLLGLGATDRP